MSIFCCKKGHNLKLVWKCTCIRLEKWLRGNEIKVKPQNRSYLWHLNSTVSTHNAARCQAVYKMFNQWLINVINQNITICTWAINIVIFVRIWCVSVATQSVDFCGFCPVCLRAHYTRQFIDLYQLFAFRYLLKLYVCIHAPFGLPSSKCMCRS